MDYVFEEEGLKQDKEEGIKMYVEYIKQRKIYIYNTVRIEEGDKIKSDYNVLQEI